MIIRYVYMLIKIAICWYF